MPLVKSGSNKARGENIAEMIRSGYAPKVAAAASYSNQRKYRADGGSCPYPMAAGGNPLQAPWYARAEAHGLEHSGFIHSPTAGRTDKLPMAVPGGSHVIPADVVSAVGQGNSLAGAGAFNRLFHQGPYGSAPAHIATPHAAMGIRQKFEQGGTPSVDIAASGGEYIVKPESVALIGGGDMKKGHDAIDHMILQLRKKHIKTLRKLKPPKKS